MAIAALVFLSAADVARAEDVVVETGASVEVNTGTVKPAPALIRAEAMKAKIDARTEATKEKVEARADAAKARIETRVENVKERVELRIENRAELQAKAEARKEKIRTEKKAKLDEAKKKRVETAARNSVRVLTNALTRVQELSVKVEARIAKAESAGVVATDARARLAEGNTLWLTAKVKVDGLEADLTAALASETPIAAFETFRTHAGEAKDGIKAAHAKIVEAVAALKATLPAPSASVETSAQVEVTQ